MEKVTTVPGGPAHYLARFGEQSIACNQYALAKLGIDKNHCSLKFEDYVIMCTPFQLGFKRSLFMTSASKAEMAFFHRYVDTIATLSITFSPAGRLDPVNFFVRCTLSALGPVKDRENTGLFAVDFKPAPDELVVLLGSFLEHQEKLRVHYEDYAAKFILFTPETAKRLGYNMQATVTEPGSPPRRIQIVSLSTQSIGHLEAADTPLRPPGTGLAYQIAFSKGRVTAAGKVESSDKIPQGLVRTISNLSFTPDLVEVVDDYWINNHPAQVPK